jgi:peptide/nickel transport system substrate-binding protein
MAALGFNDTDGDGVLNVPDTAEAQEFDPVRTVSFSDSGDTEVGAGRNFKLRLFVRDDDEEDKVAAELIEAWYEEAGVDVDRQLVKEDPQLYDASYPSSSNADMDMYIWGWGPDPDPDFILSVFSCAQINNWQDANYCNEEYDELYASTKNATSLEERRQAILDAQEMIFHESPYAVLWYTDSIEAYRSDRWEGFRPHPEGDGYLWTSWGFGPYGSRTSVAPLGAAASPDPGESAGATGSPGAGESASPDSSGGATTQPSTPGAGSEAGGSNMPLLVGAAALIGALVVGGALIARRRSAPDDEE